MVQDIYFFTDQDWSKTKIKKKNLKPSKIKNFKDKDKNEALSSLLLTFYGVKITELMRKRPTRIQSMRNIWARRSSTNWPRYAKLTVQKQEAFADQKKGREGENARADEDGIDNCWKLRCFTCWFSIVIWFVFEYYNKRLEIFISKIGNKKNL